MPQHSIPIAASIRGAYDFATSMFRKIAASASAGHGQTNATAAPSEQALAEVAEYFPAAGAHLHTVFHAAQKPVARVLLAGPFASERHYSIEPWVKWARYLAARGVEALRFDYRGVGESEGVFEECSFTQWNADVALLAASLENRSPRLPLILNGLGMGGLLVAKAFAAGSGDVLLLWSTPADANAGLRPTLLRSVMADQLFKYGEDRKPASAYIREMEKGSTIEIEGYRWSADLWSQSKELRLPPALSDPGLTATGDGRPVRSIILGKEAVPLVKGGPAVADEPKDQTPFFAQNWEWLRSALAAQAQPPKPGVRT